MTKTTALKSVPKTSELDGFYDNLTAEGQQQCDEIHRRGFKVSFTEDGYVAHPLRGGEGDEAQSLAALYGAITTKYPDPIEDLPLTDESDFKGRNTDQHPTREPLIADENGDTFLPGVEELVEVMPDIPELRQPALDLSAAIGDFDAAKSKRDDAQEAVDALLRRYRTILPTDG